jgi:hypothetical protein
MRLDPDGKLWIAKGSPAYDWSGGLHEVPVLDIQETWTAGQIFEKDIQIGTGSETDDSSILFTTDSHSAKFHWDYANANFELSDTLFIASGGLGVGVAPTATTLNAFSATVASGNAIRLIDASLVYNGTDTVNGCVVCETRYTSATTVSKTHTGGRFSAFFNSTGGCDLTGGKFIAGKTTDAEWTIGDASTWLAGQFVIRDQSTAATSRRVNTVNCCRAGFDTTMDGNVEFKDNLTGYYVEDLTGGMPPQNAATDFIHAFYSEAQDGANKGALHGNITHGGGDWDTGHIQLENGHIWNDPTNNAIRFLGSAPGASTNGVGITGATDTPTTDPGWTASSTIDMNAPDGYIQAYVGAQAVVVPYWNT